MKSERERILDFCLLNVVKRQVNRVQWIWHYEARCGRSYQKTN